MVTKTTYFIGFLTIVLLLSGVVYISLNNQVRIRIDNDKAVFYNKNLDENGNPVGRWLISGLQEDRLFKGTDELTISIPGYNILRPFNFKDKSFLQDGLIKLVIYYLSSSFYFVRFLRLYFRITL